MLAELTGYDTTNRISTEQANCLDMKSPARSVSLGQAVLRHEGADETGFLWIAREVYGHK
jgi:hypothetical protein